MACWLFVEWYSAVCAICRACPRRWGYWQVESLGPYCMKVVILVGGETTGTRFRPLTMDTYKCLFPVAGKPILSHILAKLQLDLGSQIDEIYLVSFFKDTSKFERYIDDARAEFPFKLTLLTEPQPMGTGGGIFHFQKQILANDPDSILFIHGDVVCDYPFKELVEHRKRSGAQVAMLGVDPLALIKNKLNEGQDKEQLLRRYGTAFSTRSSHDIVHYVEKPESDSFAKFDDTRYQTTVNAGIYAFSPEIFALLAQAKARKAAEPFSERPTLSLELDVFKTLPALEAKFTNLVFGEPWFQLTTPSLALAANAFFLQRSGRSQGAVAQNGGLVGPNVTIGRNVTLGHGVRLRNCILCDDVVVGDHAIVVNSIVSHGVKIGPWGRVEGTLGGQVSEPSAEHGSKLLANMVVLCRDVTVAPNVFVYNSVVLPHKELRSDTKYEIVM